MSHTVRRTMYAIYCMSYTVRRTVYAIYCMSHTVRHIQCTYSVSYIVSACVSIRLNNKYIIRGRVS